MKFPTMDEFCQSVAEKALDEYMYNGKTIREWADLILNQEKLQKECEWCKEDLYVKTIQNTKPVVAPLTEAQALRDRLIELTGEIYIPISKFYCPMCGRKLGDEE